jgi:signal peptide peptidase SppA
MAKHYHRVLKMVSEHPWAILPARLDVIVEIMQMRAAGLAFTDEEIQARIGAAPRPAPSTAGTVVVLPLHGVIAPRMNAMTQISGGTSVEVFGALVQRAVDAPGITAVVLDVDSPGGSVFGVEEVATKIRGLRGRKPIVAVANTMMASAAYFIASQADEIVASPSSQVGSIGVIATHTDESVADEKAGIKTTYITAGKYKGDAAPGVPLTESARSTMQGLVDSYYRAFVHAVAKGRGVPVSAVTEGYGEGAIVSARDAVKFGMADGLGTLDEVVARMASGAKSAITARAETELVTGVTLPAERDAVAVAEQARQLRERLAAAGA